MLPTALHLIGLCAVFCISSSSATPLPFYSTLEGSTDEEELGNFTFFFPPTSNSSSPEYQTTPVGPTHVEPDFLSQVVNFLAKNILLTLVAGSFILLAFLIICGAICLSRRRKVNAYYPSSFPSKMYVDHRDKTGGAKPFNEVPEKPAPEQQSEPVVDSHKQLQADIMRAAKNLRTPNKSSDAAEGSDPGQKEADHSCEDSSKPDGGILDQQLSSLPEEKEQSEVSDSEAAAAAGSPELNPSELNPLEQPKPEQPRPEEDDSQEPQTGRSLRPSSLHIHNDSATLQLIAGEKTAF
ncbi:transmembrane protein 119b [Symphorus nematophorus]